jgi:hypothetical protein
MAIARLELIVDEKGFIKVRHLAEEIQKTWPAPARTRTPPATATIRVELQIDDKWTIKVKRLGHEWRTAAARSRNPAGA